MGGLFVSGLFCFPFFFEVVVDGESELRLSWFDAGFCGSEWRLEWFLSCWSQGFGFTQWACKYLDLPTGGI